MSLKNDRGLGHIVTALARSLKIADAAKPVAVGRSGREWRPGIGPHSESESFALIAHSIERVEPELARRIDREVPYPSGSRQRCDLVIRDESGEIEWAIEAKLLRFLGDNGKPNDNMLMHVISPYDHDRSALTDCRKLLSGELGRRYAVVILGYESDERPLEPAVLAFEILASSICSLGPRVVADADELVHPVHHKARIFGWEVTEHLHD